jgi:hypothetical protein
MRNAPDKKLMSLNKRLAFGFASWSKISQERLANRCHGPCSVASKVPRRVTPEACAARA